MKGTRFTQDQAAAAAQEAGAIPVHRRRGVLAAAAVLAIGLLGTYRPLGITPAAEFGSVIAMAIAGAYLLAMPLWHPSGPTSREVQPRHETLVEEIQRLEGATRLSRSVVHDFVNVLTVIGMHCEFMLQGMKPGEVHHEEVLAILEASQRGSKLSHELLDFTRERALTVGPLNLNDVVRNATPMLERLVGREVSVDVRLDKTIGIVLADVGQIRQLIVNLALNARDAMPNGGVLTISTANADLDETIDSDDQPVMAGQYVMLAVSDTGRGMGPDVQRRAFEPFFTTKFAGSGTAAGVGLTTVSKIVRQCGGHIWVHSEPGVGSVFKIYLPLIAGGRDGTDAPSTSGRRTHGETILVVEDSESARATARRILQQEGHHVLEAPRGPAALVAASSFADDIALILIDAVMPHAHGAWLVDGLLSRHPEAGVLYMSGYPAAAGERRIGGAPEVLLKPLSARALVGAVREALEGRRAAHQPVPPRAAQIAS